MERIVVLPYLGMLPILNLLLEVRASRRMAARLLDTYVGHEAGERILHGDVVRGEVFELAGKILVHE